MSNIRNLWGNLSIEEYTQNPLKNPSILLKEQANLISQITKGLILGEVISVEYKLPEYQPSSVEQLLVNKYVVKSIPPIPNKSSSINNPNDSQNQNFSQILRLKVPSLNNYTYSLLQIIYNITDFYPVIVYNFVNGNQPERCNNEEEFLSVLESILSSEQVHHVIQVLLSQIV
jgi:hypothetical protein